jgi:D-alanyl-D-alanine carboxypeptidase
MKSTVILFLLMVVSIFTGCKKETIHNNSTNYIEVSAKMTNQISPEEEKLSQLLTKYPLPFNNENGEANQIAERIMQDKKGFLTDLQKVLEADTWDSLILADKKHFLSEEYEPSDLVSLTPDLATAHSYVINRNDLSLRAPVEKALQVMAEAAKSEGITLVVSSTYRTYNYQKKIYERNVAQMGKTAADRESAAPGTSQHQLGVAIDFGSITDEYAETKAGKWLAANASKYGFSLSFPNGYEAVTGYRWECWHYRYVGEAAISFQEKWFNNVQQYMIEFIHAWRQ